jgi:hypothetical protein
MDASLKELEKLEKLTSLSGKSKASSVNDTLDGLLSALQALKQQIESGLATPYGIESISRVVEERKKDLDERQREVYGSITRLGKTLDKVSSLRLLRFLVLPTTARAEMVHRNL